MRVRGLRFLFGSLLGVLVLAPVALRAMSGADIEKMIAEKGAAAAYPVLAKELNAQQLGKYCQAAYVMTAAQSMSCPAEVEAAGTWWKTVKDSPLDAAGRAKAADFITRMEKAQRLLSEYRDACILYRMYLSSKAGSPPADSAEIKELAKSAQDRLAILKTDRAPGSQDPAKVGAHFKAQFNVCLSMGMYVSALSSEIDTMAKQAKFNQLNGK
jgi:hypothetical protein